MLMHYSEVTSLCFIVELLGVSSQNASLSDNVVLGKDVCHQ